MYFHINGCTASTRISTSQEEDPKYWEVSHVSHEVLSVKEWMRCGVWDECIDANRRVWEGWASKSCKIPLKNWKIIRAEEFLVLFWYLSVPHKPLPSLQVGYWHLMGKWVFFFLYINLTYSARRNTISLISDFFVVRYPERQCCKNIRMYLQ